MVFDPHPSPGCTARCVEPEDVLAGDDLLDGIDDLGLLGSVPDSARAMRLARAVAVVEREVGELSYPGGVRTSPVHPGWAGDVDVHVRSLPDADRLRRAGWLSMDALLGRLGSRGHGRWAVVEHEEVLARADFHLSLPPEPVASVIQRCRRRGEVRLREVLELRSLAHRGLVLPNDPVVIAAAAVEAALGGDRLASFRSSSPMAPPVKLDTPLRALRRSLGQRRQPRLVIAISGMDGEGKSTLIRRLEEDLTSLGLPVAAIWARPGMDLGWLGHLAQLAKRLLGERSEPGVRAMARGGGAELRSRRGSLGWCWSMLVTLSFVAAMRRHRRATRNGRLILCDRHRVDALVSLELLYAGVDLRTQRMLLSRALPPADLTVYLDVPTEVATLRKPEDPLAGVASLNAQHECYSLELRRLPSQVAVLDATQPPDRLARDALRRLMEVA